MDGVDYAAGAEAGSESNRHAFGGGGFWIRMGISQASDKDGMSIAFQEYVK
jgi:hypothetical protein